MDEVPNVPQINSARVIIPRVRVVTAATEEPITATVAKDHLHITGTDHDTWLATHIGVAREDVERILSRSLITQTLEHYLDDWPDGEVIPLPRPPLQSVTSVIYYDVDGVAATLSTSVYQVDTYSTPGRISLKPDQDWPTDDLQAMNGVVIKYVAGYGAAATVPPLIRAAILHLIAWRFEHRGDDADVASQYPPGFDFLLNSFRAVTFA